MVGDEIFDKVSEKPSSTFFAIKSILIASFVSLLCENVDVFWQNKACVDKVVMKDLAVKFVNHKNEVHGVDKWVILFCDNLSAHLDEEVRNIFGDAKVFLCYFPPNMTNFIQPIDAGMGR